MRLRSSSFLRLAAVIAPIACSVTACASSASKKGDAPFRASAAPANVADASDLADLPEEADADVITAVALPPSDAAMRARFDEERAATQAMTADEFERRYALPFRDRLPYAPLAAAGLASIETKRGALTGDEEARLARDGFAILTHEEFPSFGRAYADAFRRHLPVYISADSILFAVHKSFDALLKAVEREMLSVDLGVIVSRMRAALKAGALAGTSPDAVADVDDYLAVAAGLLAGNAVEPVASGHAASVNAIVARASAGAGTERVVLFGHARDVDFSQFKPRGHYQESPELEHYFRATMWLSRTDFRLIEVTPTGSQVFRRRQLEGASALRDLMDETTRALWTRIDRSIGAFVGEPDEMNVRGIDALMRELGIAKGAELTGKSDDVIVATLARTGLGQQRIASQLMEHAPEAKGTLPLHTSFALMNQRYTLDAHVLANVSYDRVRSGTVKRMMPDPLDVGFAALGNDGAAELLRGDLDRFGYAPDLHMMRFLASAHGEDYWQKSLYTTWSSALRALSPTEAALTDPKKGGLPSVAATHAWNKRMLSTQLASWAELRHDTVLYAKQSYSGMMACEFPDAYVEPYPEFFHRIALHARLGKQLASEAFAEHDKLANVARTYFTHLDDVATKLERMAKQEREGKPFTKAQMDFVNDMITSRSVGCGSVTFSGWYGDLFIDRMALSDFTPTIADVHTQPTDEDGNMVGRVLHAGTGYVNGLVVTVDSCHGPRAYAGYVSSYYEKTTANFERLDDVRWERELRKTPRPPWLAGVVPR